MQAHDITVHTVNCHSTYSVSWDLFNQQEASKESECSFNVSNSCSDQFLTGSFWKDGWLLARVSEERETRIWFCDSKAEMQRTRQSQSHVTWKLEILDLKAEQFKILVTVIRVWKGQSYSGCPVDHVQWVLYWRPWKQEENWQEAKWSKTSH